MTGFRIARRQALGLVVGGLAMPGIVSAGARRALAAAPLQGISRPGHTRFMLGSFEVTMLFDGAVQLDGPHPIFGEDQPAETVQALAEANFLPPTKMEISFMPVLVNTGDSLVLFDTGNGEGRRPAAGNLPDVIRAAGYDPAQIDTVVITHMHGDHVGGLMEGGKPTYPNAAYVTAAPEFDFWTAAERADGPAAGNARIVQEKVVPLAEKFRFVADGGEVVPGIHAIEAFGHTPGHMAYHVESGGERLLLWADTSNHFVLSVERPQWHVRFDMDKEGAVATRKKLFDMASTDRLLVAGYHMPFPGLGYVEARDSGYRWVQATSQPWL